MLNGKGRFAVLAVAIVLGALMPVAGISLLFFIAIDWLRWFSASHTVLAQSAE